jgi:hypothetical protein
VPVPSKPPGNGRARRRLWLLAIFLLLVGAAAAAWVERSPLLAWAYIQGLRRASEADCDAWAERVASLDQAAVPGLLSCLAGPDGRGCANAEAALRRLRERWQQDDPRRSELAARLGEAFAHLSVPGQQAVLRLEAVWLAHESGSSTVPQGLLQAARAGDSAVRSAALELVGQLLDHPVDAGLLGDCRELTQVALRDPDAATRLHAIQVAVHPQLGLLEQVMRLLNDPAPEVRREAMLAARSAPEAIMKTENLLHWLHDPDDDVRRLCEAVLRGRNLSEKHLKLGRLLTDERAAVRLQVLTSLHADTDLEPGVWLRLLSIDPEPAVRVAAVRAATIDPRVDLSDRLDQMVQSDPSPTVSQLARYYLSCQQRRKLSTIPSASPH